MLRNKPLKHSQQGQGMVEYAIMLILLITLVIGGIELSGATLASGKASDAAKAAVNDFATVNQKRLNAQANQQKYLRQIDIILNGAIFAVDGNGLFAEPNAALVISSNAGTPEFEDYVKFLDSVSNAQIADSNPDLVSAFLDAFFDEANVDGFYFFDLYNKDEASNVDDDADVDGETGDLEEIIASIDGAIDTNNDGIIDGDDADGEISREELIYAVQQGKIKQKILNLAPNDDDDDGTGEAAKGTADGNDRIVRYKALLLFEELELAILPLDPRIGLSQSIPLLGDHDPDIAEFVRPSCTVNVGDVEYDYGLPDADNDGVADRALAFTMTTETGTADVEADFPAVYLFNPLPIQLDSCVGNDANRNDQSTISILVGGYAKEGDEFYEPGLPKLNESFYGQYSKVCLNATNEYVSCNKAYDEIILKPPGKTCFLSTESATVDSCTLDDPPEETSGYYFWGKANQAQTEDGSGNKIFRWDFEDDIQFRPTFQLQCNGIEDFSNISNDECYDDIQDANVVANLKTIQVNVRYRHVFESFLTFGMMELADNDLAQYFYDPSNLRSPAVTVGAGIAGSELGPKASGGNPTVKQFKDFRGCYEVNVETNQINNCN